MLYGHLVHATQTWDFALVSAYTEWSFNFNLKFNVYVSAILGREFLFLATFSEVKMTNDEKFQTILEI